MRGVLRLLLLYTFIELLRKRDDFMLMSGYITMFLLIHISLGTALGYGLDDQGFRVDSRRGLGIFLFTTASRTALRPTQPPIQWVPRALSLGVKRPGREADHSPPSRAEVKE
jgi:hypothetical protein